MVRHKPLIVYKASAGSGKTFTLATEYIKLLVCNPMSYREILAVTFTNKATEEMKMRILSQLYGIWKQLPDSSSYARKVEDETGLPPYVVRERSGQALHLLLHNFHAFRVETIDAFFQTALRNLARELELTANLRVGLKGDQVEELAVDQLIDNLKHSDEMLLWLLRYIMDNLNEDKSWSSNDERKTSVIHEIKSFGKAIFHDEYKRHRKALTEQILEKDVFEAFIRHLHQLRRTAKERIQAIGSSYFEILEREGLSVSDIKGGGRGVSSFFNKLSQGLFEPTTLNVTTLKATESADLWVRKDHPQADAIRALADNSLMPLLHQAIEEREHQWKMFQSATLTLANLNNLRLLNIIEQKVNQINSDANLFLLGNTQHLLHALIQDSDSPFIFEKIGAQLRHVMIDEFQDTGAIQWQNFKVLMKECMSHQGTENLIVGDVKQSIYRWRSGDWRLLNHIESQFPDEMMEVKSLNVNYRSERHVIEFNNAFFSLAAQHEETELSEYNEDGAGQLRNAYQDVCQEVPDGRLPQGGVSIRLLPSQDYNERTLLYIEETIRNLLQHGIPQHRIAILVRFNYTISMIADYLTEHIPEISIVSDEAFRLDASVSVGLLIQALHVLTHPTDQLTKANIVKTYHRDVLGESIPDNKLFLRGIQLDDLLPKAYITHFEDLLQLPLYELVEQLYQIFGLERLKDQSAYVCAFYDCLTQFTQDNSTGIDDFIETWELELRSKTIQSDELTGIRMMTIHKSKGLEYDYVLFPFCDWRLERGNTIWCEPRESPFNTLPVIPVQYNKKQMMGTIYESDYHNEHLQLTVDHLNLLYVAFTRARKNLFVFGRRKNTGCRSALIETVLPAVSQSLTGSFLNGVDDEQQDMTFDYGDVFTSMATIRQQSDNVFLQPVSPLAIHIEASERKAVFRQSNKSQEFVLSDEDDDTRQDYVKLGSVLHHVFSGIRTTADIGHALKELEQEGILYSEYITSSRIIDLLRKRLEHPMVREWFSPHWRLFNECTILTTDADGHVHERRPDRVMTDRQRTVVVDFKFGKPHADHHEQVREYMELLRQMGHQQTEGYLWYVYSNHIETVTVTP